MAHLRNSRAPGWSLLSQGFGPVSVSPSMPIRSPVCRCHTRTSSSELADSPKRPSGLTATAQTMSPCASIVRSGEARARSQ